MPSSAAPTAPVRLSPNPDGRLDAPGTAPRRASTGRSDGRRWSLRPSDHVGPNWFTAVMGTGILATAVENFTGAVPWLHVVAVVALVVAWIVFTAVGTGFLAHALRDPARFRATLGDIAIAPFYGAVAMGVLSVGAATFAVAGRHLPAAAAATAWVLWALGTVLGVATALLHPVRVIAVHPAERRSPTPVWALPVVPPMVAATGGAVLSTTVPPGGASFTVLLVCGALFGLALYLGIIVFVLAYGHLMRGNSLPLQGSAAIWIPVGVAGQSTAAANQLLAHAGDVVSPPAHGALHAIVVAYSAVTLILGAAAVAIALRVTVSALRRGMTFSLGWWSFTFPVGTLSLGLFAFGTTLQASWLLWAAAAVCACLTGTVGMCLVRSARFWVTGRL
ncbi:TDT family transporter [Kocuria flava]|uniref:TDT family transporter n=1 Tax=Kocuria flava TaxID=446860 RepID=UPI001FF3B01B|nr:TDT family transporter [Kocuria flava]MCJ8503455.1 TDT family transporter [Kocuria flava]